MQVAGVSALLVVAACRTSDPPAAWGEATTGSRGGRSRSITGHQFCFPAALWSDFQSACPMVMWGHRGVRAV